MSRGLGDVYKRQSLSNILLVSYVDNTLLFIVDVAAWTGMHMYMDKVIERKKAINNVTTD